VTLRERAIARESEGLALLEGGARMREECVRGDRPCSDHEVPISRRAYQSRALLYTLGLKCISLSVYRHI
jgi:hypothetical protein